VMMIMIMLLLNGVNDDDHIKLMPDFIY